MVAFPQLKDKLLLGAERKQGEGDKMEKKSRKLFRGSCAWRRDCRGRPVRDSSLVILIQLQSHLCLLVIFRNNFVSKENLSPKDASRQSWDTLKASPATNPDKPL